MRASQVEPPELVKTDSFYYDGASFISATSFTAEIAKGLLVSTELEVTYGERPIVYNSFMYKVSYDGGNSWNDIQVESTENPIDAVNNGSASNSKVVNEVVNSIKSVIKQFIRQGEVATVRNPLLGLFVNRIDDKVIQVDTIQVNITSRTGFESIPITDNFSTDIMNSIGFEPIPITDNFDTDITNTTVMFTNIPITDQFTTDIEN